MRELLKSLLLRFVLSLPLLGGAKRRAKDFDIINGLGSETRQGQATKRDDNFRKHAWRRRPLASRRIGSSSNRRKGVTFS